MTDIKLTCGYEGQVDETAFDDYYFMEQLAKLEDGNVLAFPKLLNMIMAEPEKKKLMKALENESGRIPSAVYLPVMQELFSQMGESVKK